MGVTINSYKIPAKHGAGDDQPTDEPAVDSLHKSLACDGLAALDRKDLATARGCFESIRDVSCDMDDELPAP